MLSLLELFVSVDDFCQGFLPFWERKLLEDGSRKRQRAGQLSVSEIMTVIIYFHQSHYRNFSLLQGTCSPAPARRVSKIGEL